MDRKDTSDTWERGNPYERYVGRWSRQVAGPFLSWLNLPAGQAWLDVGCGTGALCAAIVDRCSAVSVAGVEPSPGFLETARQNLANQVALHAGSATEIPLNDSSVDVVVSALVLNFVPDQHAALNEMARVTKNGGTVAAYVWDYANKMEFMRYFWDAAIEMNPAAVSLDEGNRFPLCRPGPLSQLFASAKLNSIDVAPIDVNTSFSDFDDFWQPFLGGQGPAPSYVMSLNEEARTRLRDRLRERIPESADGTLSMVARAWAVRATVEK